MRHPDYRTKPARQMAVHEVMRYGGLDYQLASLIRKDDEIELICLRVNPEKTAITNGLVRTVKLDAPILYLYDPIGMAQPPVDTLLWNSALERLLEWVSGSQLQSPVIMQKDATNE